MKRELTSYKHMVCAQAYDKHVEETERLTRLLPPGKRKNAGPISARVFREECAVRSTKRVNRDELTSAISMRNPFGRSLKVGGKSDSMAKLMVSPAASAPSTEMKKLLLTSGAELVGLSSRLTCFQSVAVPRTSVVACARTVPPFVRNPTVSVPEKDEGTGKR